MVKNIFGNSRLDMEIAGIILILIFISVFLIGYELTTAGEDWKGAIKYIDANTGQGEVLYGNALTTAMYGRYGKIKDLVMFDVRYVNSRDHTHGWLLLRRPDFIKAFTMEKLNVEKLKAREISRYKGLVLYHIRTEQ